MTHSVMVNGSARQRAEKERALAPPPKSAAKTERNAREWEQYELRVQKRVKDAEAERRAEQVRDRHARATEAERQRRRNTLEMARIAREMLFNEYGLSRDEIQRVTAELTPADLADTDASRVTFLCQQIQKRRDA